MSKYHDDATAASDPIHIGLSDAKLRRLQPELFNWMRFFVRFPLRPKPLGARQVRELIAEHLDSGDTEAAVVIKVDPLLVAAHSTELDCVGLLRFDDWLTQEFNLRVGTRLLTVNSYGRGARVPPDLEIGPDALGRWTNFHPMIGE